MLRKKRATLLTPSYSRRYGFVGIEMENKQTNYENPEEELELPLSPFEIPGTVKIGVTVAAALLVCVCVYLVSKYLYSPKTFASPKDLSLTSIFLFSISALVVVWVPWHRLGVRITKIGGIEFKDIVEEQASEHAEEISDLQDRIEVLEAKVRKSDGMAEITEYFAEPELRKLLLKFLTEYDSWAFSPSRIRAWGAQQDGFSELSNYERQFLRSTLQKMVSENILETRISKKGNTLYRVIKP